MSYFQDHYDLFRYPLDSPGQAGFRVAQLGAIHAVAGHFAHRSDPAIVTMPTGSGKTGVMTASAFVLRPHRVLVVTPSRLVREQIAEEITNLSLLSRLNALPRNIHRPQVASVRERVGAAERWRELRDNDVVVGTVQSISPALDGVADPEPDQFDLVMVDEAHHSSARTWQALLDCFPSARRVLFTATPFRRDRHEIRGRFVFTYDLQQARRDGVFGHIRYRAVQQRGDLRARDIAVAVATHDQFLQDRAAGLDHLLMVRTDRKTRAHELAQIYAEHTELRLLPLNSDHSLRHAKTVIRRLREGTLDGIITVNMLGEGFDFPRLKIAAIHAPHRSLAATLQFIGRFARTVGQNLGAATFLAVPDDIEIERRRLFEAGAAWQELVENLNAEQIEREANIRDVLETFDPAEEPAPDIAELSLHSLEPYHHVKIYRGRRPVDLQADLAIPGSAVVYHSVSEAQDAAVWITRERSTARWSRDGRIVDVRHGLFVVYWNDATQLLFICASIRSAGLYDHIARRLMDGEPRILSLARINRALNGLQSLKFFNVGMRNRVLGNQTESYRIITGPSADRAILPSDARLFHRGHCYGTGETNDSEITIGLSSASKVWSNRSSQIPDLIAWCAELARRIETDVVPVTGGGLDHLTPGEEVDRLPPGIFRADWDYDVYRNPRVAELHANGGSTTVQLLDLDIEIERDKCTDSSIALVLRTGEVGFRATFSFDMDRLFEPRTNDGVTVDVAAGNRTIPLIDFLNECPLCFYTEDLSLLRGSDLYRPFDEEDRRPFPADQVEVVRWEHEGVDPQHEFGLARNGLRSIQDFLEVQLAGSPASVVYCDHGSGEVADFVTFEERDGHVVVCLFHCKGAGGAVPGDRVNDAYEVCGQAIKSVVYADPSRLIGRIAGRHERRAGVARFAKGDRNILQGLLQAYGRAQFQFAVVVVQPGIARNQLSPRIANLLSATNDYIVRGGFAPLRVMGS